MLAQSAKLAISIYGDRDFNIVVDSFVQNLVKKKHSVYFEASQLTPLLCVQGCLLNIVNLMITALMISLMCVWSVSV